jgi:uncharacterized MAPEG superfamily protein
MKPELIWLLWAVALAFAQMLVAVGGAALQVGLPTLVGNRDGLLPCTGWAGRASRAHHNMLESLVLFTALVLVAVTAGKTSDTTAFAAQLFVWTRLAYAVIYVAGIPWLRTAVWLASVWALILIFWAVLQVPR